MPVIKTTKEVWDSKIKDRKFWLYVDEGAKKLSDGTIVTDPWVRISKSGGYPHKEEVHVFEPGEETPKKHSILIHRVTWQKSKIMPEIDKKTLTKTLCWGIQVSLDPARPEILPPPVAPAPKPEPKPAPTPEPEPVVDSEDDLTEELIEAYSEPVPEPVVEPTPEPEPVPTPEPEPKPKKKTPPKKKAPKKDKIPELNPIKEKKKGKKAKKPKKVNWDKKSYPEIQTMAIKHGIKGNQKRDKLIKALEKVI